MLKIKLRYHWRIFTSNTALLLVKIAGKINRRSVELFSYHYVETNYDDFQEWSLDRSIREYYAHADS